MNKRVLKEKWGINCDTTTIIGKYEAFLYRNILYIIVPVEQMEQDELLELKQLSDFMIQKGDYTVASMMQTKTGTFTDDLNGQQVLLLRYPYLQMARPSVSIGKSLAKFHEKGRTFPYQVTKCKRIGEWKYLWERRLDQMEMFWQEKMKQKPSAYFERLFVESFPYYIGLTENAIQYIVDTELDDDPGMIDAATICYHRFTPTTWEEMNHIKLPNEWVFDHCSRDLSEFIRYSYFNVNRNDLSEAGKLLHDYEQVKPLTTFSKRLLFARLLFPLHYFELIEGYYLVQNEEKQRPYEEKLEECLNSSNAYEHFLSNLQPLLGEQRVSKKNIPKVDWLLR
ncbi:spore coat protein YutH [Bacillus timonensis]|nr:spore coat protein YutH [Bacillus timonensis]